MAAAPTPDLLCNIFRETLFDSLVSETCIRLAGLVNKENLELEGKIGILNEKNSPNKYIVPEVENGILLLVNRMAQATPYNFVSNMDSSQWHHLVDKVLTGRLMNWRNHHIEPEMLYIKTHTIDTFYANGLNSTIRVTRDKESNKIMECITKENILEGNINYLNNRGMYDFRISAKSEKPVDPPPDNVSPLYSREKIRKSFVSGFWSIDCTEVRTKNVVNRTASMAGTSHNSEYITTYELEVEMRQEYVPLFRQALDDSIHHRNGNFQRIIRSLLDTLRTLITFADPTKNIPVLCLDKPVMGGSNNPNIKKIKPFPKDTIRGDTLVQLNAGAEGESRI